MARQSSAAVAPPAFWSRLNDMDRIKGPIGLDHGVDIVGDCLRWYPRQIRPIQSWRNQEEINSKYRDTDREDPGHGDLLS